MDLSVVWRRWFFFQPVIVTEWRRGSWLLGSSGSSKR
jgi:hypothetical protein